MKITYREKVLLGLLAAVALIAFSYYVLFKPQLDKITQLTLENTELKMKVQETETEIASIPLKQTMLLELEKSLQEKTAKFYPEIIQDRIIVITDGLIKRTQLKSQTSSYGQISIIQVQKPAPDQTKEFPAKTLVDEYVASTGVSVNDKPEGNGQEAAPDQNKDSAKSADKPEAQPAEVQSMSVTLQFEGSYEQAVRLIKEIEALGRTIVIPDLALVYGENNVLTGNIRIDFYALPKIVEQDKAYLDWPYNNKYGKVNPFVK